MPRQTDPIPTAEEMHAAGMHFWIPGKLVPIRWGFFRRLGVGREQRCDLCGATSTERWSKRLPRGMFPDVR